MKPAKHYYFLFLVLIALSLAACTRNLSGFNGTSNGGGNNGNGGTGGGTGGGGNNNATTFTIGGKVTGLLGIGMVLEDNGGDDLTAAGNGSFTFKTAVNGAYNVTVKTQPTSPVQLCKVTNGSGTATANITTVQVNCGGGGLTIGGSVSGLIGSGLVLQDNGGDNFPVAGVGNVPFTFASSLNAGATYAVTILTQPSNPTQTCNVVNGTGTVTSNVTNVQVICTQPGFTIGGTIVGLVVAPPPADTLELQDNAGDDLFVSGDTPWKFPTAVTNGGIYNVSMFLPPNSQPQPCTLFFYTGIATANVSSVLVDCEHNDWGWTSWYLGATTAANNYAAITTPLFPKNVVAPPDLGLPGGRDFATAWTDNSGRKWLFGGFGFPYPSPFGNQLPSFLNDLWMFLPGEGWIPANLPTMLPPLATQWIVDPTSLEFEDVSNGGSPGSRWGSSGWTDLSGNLWLFGGQGFDSTGQLDPTLLSDVWTCTPGAASVDSNGAGTSSCPWALASGSTVGNQKGVYTVTMSPGGRWAAASATDTAGNFWLFGGQGFDSAGTVGLLNDLWMFNPGSKTWTWEGPSTSNVANHNGSYPASPGLTSGTGTTAPGARQAAVMWVDSSNNVWLFGGFGLDSKGTTGSTGPGGAAAGALLNDLWEFNFATKQWNWVSGGNVANQTGIYGTQATANQATPFPPGFTPGSRWGASGWRDGNNNLWLFAGWGYGSVSTDPTGFLNDIWEYQASSGNWVWWKGTSAVNQNGLFAIQSIPGGDGALFVQNIVGARRGAALWSPGPFGYVMMFGGEGYDASQGAPPGYLDDLWTYLPFP